MLTYVCANESAIALMLTAALVPGVPWWATALVVALLWSAVALRWLPRKRRKTPLAAGVVTLLCALAFATSFAFSDLCVCLHPLHLSSGLSRRLSGSMCTDEAVCHVYATSSGDLVRRTAICARAPRCNRLTPKPQAHQMIVNFHVRFDGAPHERALDGASVLFGAPGATQRLARANATCFQMHDIPEEARFVCWAELNDLEPDSAYEVRPVLPAPFDRFATMKTTFRTVPLDGDVAFAFGGDYETGTSGKLLLAHARDRGARFLVIGGDLAYANGFSSCYRRWDEFLLELRENLPVPLVISLGNHDVSTYFFAPRSDIPFILQYFPMQTHLAGIDPQQRPTYSAHSAGNHLQVLSLDSDVVEPLNGTQLQWMRAQVQQHNKTWRFASYHYPIYTSKPSHTWMDDFIARAKRHWLPVFNQTIDVAAENHMHIFKRTYALAMDKVVGSSNSTNGTTYLGDGALGIHHGGHGQESWYTEAVLPTLHIYFATVNRHMLRIDAINQENETFSRIEKVKM